MARRGASAALALVCFFATILAGECSTTLSHERRYAGILKRCGGLVLFTRLKPCFVFRITYQILASPFSTCSSRRLPNSHTPFSHQQGGTGLTLPPHKRERIRWTAYGPTRPQSPLPSARRSWSARGPRQKTGCCHWCLSARGRRCWRPSRFTCSARISTGSRSSSTGARWASSKPSLATHRTRSAADFVGCETEFVARQHLPLEAWGGALGSHLGLSGLGI